MNTNFRNWSEFYKKISLLFNAIIAFSLLPFAWLYLELEKFRKDSYFTGEELWIFQIVGVAIIAAILYFGNRSFRTSLEEKDNSLPVREKLGFYFKIAVKRFIIYELAAILCLAATYFAQELTFAVLYVFILFIFSLARPKYDNVVIHLNLNEAEKKLLASNKDLP